MATVPVLVLRSAGTNCDLETVHAWELAGAAPQRVHVRRLIENPAVVREYAIVTLPGGFSYGDDVSAGRILASQVDGPLRDELLALVDRGGLVLGICNGFQVLVKAGILPTPADRAPQATVTYNEPRGFQDRWVRLRAGTGPCAFLDPGAEYEMPIAHGEGRVVFADEAARRRAESSGCIALRYVDAPADAEGGASLAGGVGADSAPARARPPANPNGSECDAAGLCDATGRVLGLMPHPDRFVTGTQHPCWTSRPPRETGDGLRLFQRAVALLH